MNEKPDKLPYRARWEHEFGPLQPSGNHDWFDEIMGLYRVMRLQRDDETKQRIKLEMRSVLKSKTDAPTDLEREEMIKSRTPS